MYPTFYGNCRNYAEKLANDKNNKFGQTPQSCRRWFQTGWKTIWA